MKRILSFVIMVFICWGYSSADIYIKEKEHTDAYKIGEKEVPAVTLENEIWVGKHQTAYITPSYTIIYDKKVERVWYLEPRTNTYVEIGLPLDFSKVLSPERITRMAKFKVKGTVKKTGESRTFMDKTCPAYEVNYWTDADGLKFGESQGTVWIYEDISPDFSIFLELMDIVRQFYNRDETFRQELQQLKGVQIRAEFITNSQGIQVKGTSEVVEISEKEPPANIYSIPQGFTKREILF